MTFAPSAETLHLEILGMLHEGKDTVILLGPRMPGFWPAFTASAEFRDHQADPLDRYSKRVINGLAANWGGRAVFPSDGPPYPPFLSWARASGHAWVSPVGLMVHDRQGLWLSFRGAVRIPGKLPLPDAGTRPCDSCADQPCRSACPVSALSAKRYDVTLCHAHLDHPEGLDCLAQGCRARRACPVSIKYGRLAEQSEFHMKAFHKK